MPHDSHAGEEIPVSPGRRGSQVSFQPQHYVASVPPGGGKPGNV